MDGGIISLCEHIQIETYWISISDCVFEIEVRGFRDAQIRSTSTFPAPLNFTKFPKHAAHCYNTAITLLYTAPFPFLVAQPTYYSST
jgi:hypothetical protein